MAATHLRNIAILLLLALFSEAAGQCRPCQHHKRHNYEHADIEYDEYGEAENYEDYEEYDDEYQDYEEYDDYEEYEDYEEDEYDYDDDDYEFAFGIRGRQKRPRKGPRKPGVERPNPKDKGCTTNCAPDAVKYGNVTLSKDKKSGVLKCKVAGANDKPIRVECHEGKWFVAGSGGRRGRKAPAKCPATDKEYRMMIQRLYMMNTINAINEYGGQKPAWYEKK